MKSRVVSLLSVRRASRARVRRDAVSRFEAWQRSLRSPTAPLVQLMRLLAR